jgi:hypothetical protein
LHIGYRWEGQKETDNWEDKNAGGYMILKWVSQRYDGVMWTGFIWLRIGTSGGGALVSTAINLRVQENIWEIL